MKHAYLGLRELAAHILQAEREAGLVLIAHAHHDVAALLLDRRPRCHAILHQAHVLPGRVERPPPPLHIEDTESFLRHVEVVVVLAHEDLAQQRCRVGHVAFGGLIQRLDQDHQLGRGVTA